MTPEESLFLGQAEIAFLTNFATLVAITLLYGISLLLFSISTLTFMRRGLHNRPTWAMFMLTLFSFVLETIYWISITVEITILMRSALVDNIDLPLKTRIGLSNLAAYPAALVESWTSQLLPNISDIVVIWRTWVLFTEQRWVMIAPLSLLVGTIATTFSYLGLTYKLSSLEASSFGSQKLILDIQNTSLILSMATNVVATLMIAFKLWIHRKTVILGLGRRQSRSLNLLFLLVESGFLYCGFQLTTLLLNVAPPKATRSAKDLAALIFFVVYTQISAMYPTIVVVLVNHQRSMVDTYNLTAIVGSREEPAYDLEMHPVTAGHLSFAAPADSTTHSESFDGPVMRSRVMQTPSDGDTGGGSADRSKDD